jgi:hypothetical protein
VRIDGARSPYVTRFLAGLSTRLEAWRSGSSKRQLSRLRNSAMRFLATGDDVYTAWFFPARRPQLILNYVSALENLLSGGDDSHVDLSRRTAQRAAILIGDGDAHRNAIFAATRDAYKVRSVIAHGSDPEEGATMDAIKGMRPILRRALVYAIVLGPHCEIGRLCDEALLSHATLRDNIRVPIEEFRTKVGATSQGR